jgi:hypothetical protein
MGFPVVAFLTFGIYGILASRMRSFVFLDLLFCQGRTNREGASLAEVLLMPSPSCRYEPRGLGFQRALVSIQVLP